MNSKPSRVTPLKDGSLAVTLANGRTFKLRPDDELFQVYVVYKMLGGAT